MKIKTLDDFDFKNKLVLLRSDLNSDVLNGKILESQRIRESSKTIIELKKKKARIIVISHQGRKGKDDFTSLKQHAKLICKYAKIKFVNDIIGPMAEKEIKNLKPGQAILLENIRGLDDEVNIGKKENKIVDFFKNKIDIYVNDSFSVCHREQTSILLPKMIKVKSCAGRLLEKEISSLNKLKVKNCLYVLAGAKPQDNVKLLGKNKVLSGGLFGQVCLINKGKKLGKQEKYLQEKGAMIRIEPKKLKNVLTPVDFAVKINNKRFEKDLKDFPNEYEIFDIGSKTISSYSQEIKKAKAIYMKGPLGDCSDKNFQKGTFSILKAISKSKAFSIIGGGHLSDAIRDSGIPLKKFSHISLSGGALLNYIAGEKLPGIEALK